MPSAIENVAIQMPTAKLSTKDYVQLDEEYGAPSLIAAPIVITKGQGAHLWDLEGKRYIDMMSAFCVVNQGHCHPRLIGAMVEQCQTLALPSRAYHNLHYPRLCKKLCNLLDMDKAFAMNSGSEAVDLAIKMSRKWGYTVKGIAPNQAMVVTVSGNFHGKTMGPLSGSDDAFIKNGALPATSVVRDLILNWIHRVRSLRPRRWLRGGRQNCALQSLGGP